MKLRPGIIVALSVRTEGGVHYHVDDEDVHHEGEALVQEWRTVKTLDNEAEFKRATEVRSKSRSLIRGACIPTPFGVLIVPKGGEEQKKFQERVAEAQALIAEYNATAAHSKLQLNMLQGEIAETDQEAAAAIRSELAGLLEEMQGAVKGGEVKLMRDAAARATQLGKLLEAKSAAKAKLTLAVQATRSIARGVIKAGEDAAAVAVAIADEHAAPISLARFAFAGVGEDLGEETGPVRVEPTAQVESELAADPARLCACPVCQDGPVVGLDFCGACTEAGCTSAEPLCDQDVSEEAIEALRVATSRRLGIPVDDDLSEPDPLAGGAR